MNNAIRSARAWSLAAIIISVFLGAPVASATPQEERQGSQILRELESGKLQCSDASASDFELVGEYAMGRMFGSPSQHEAMNRMMSRMMGAVNAMGMMGGGMMGAGAGGGSYGPGSMMGGYGYGSSTNPNDEDFDGPSAAARVGNHMGDWGTGWWILMAFMMVAFWGLVIVDIVWLIRALTIERHGHGGANPIELPDRRLASGEISPEEYRERRAVLRGEPVVKRL